MARSSRPTPWAILGAVRFLVLAGLPLSELQMLGAGLAFAALVAVPALVLASRLRVFSLNAFSG